MFSKSVVSQACQSALTIEGINAVEEALRGDPELILAIQAAVIIDDLEPMRGLLLKLAINQKIENLRGVNYE